MPKSSKKKRAYHYKRHVANEAIWVVESRTNHFAVVEFWSSETVKSRTIEERWTNWHVLKESNVHSQRQQLTVPLNSLMIPRTLENAVPIAVLEHSRWEQRLQPKYQIQVRLRNTQTGDIIPSELFV